MVLDQAFLDTVFPAERTDAFFDALFGGAEEGAYDIRLVCRNVSDNKAELAFELHQRPGKCLVCNAGAYRCTGATLEEDLFNLVAHDAYERVPHYRTLSIKEE